MLLTPKRHSLPPGAPARAAAEAAVSAFCEAFGWTGSADGGNFGEPLKLLLSPPRHRRQSVYHRERLRAATFVAALLREMGPKWRASRLKEDGPFLTYTLRYKENR